MEYLSVSEISKKLNISERMFRNYCASNRVMGAFLVGKTRHIPETSNKPKRREKNKYLGSNNLLSVLKVEKDMNLKSGIYHKNSN